MKKAIFILIISACGLLSIVHAQAFKKGDNVASAGIGLGSSILDYSGSSQTPAISLQYENGAFPIKNVGVISLGGYVGFKTYSYSGEGYKDKWTYTIIGARSAFHLTTLKINKLDVYGGLMLSYNYLKFSDNSGDNLGGSYGSAAGFTAYVGGRYFFTNNLAAMAELGYGVSYLTLGLSLKF